MMFSDELTEHFKKFSAAENFPQFHIMDVDNTFCLTAHWLRLVSKLFTLQ